MLKTLKLNFEERKKTVNGKIRIFEHIFVHLRFIMTFYIKILKIILFKLFLKKLERIFLNFNTVKSKENWIMCLKLCLKMYTLKISRD
jgi:hypothetical protein